VVLFGQYERQVLLFTLRVQVVPETAPKMTVKQVLGKLKVMHDNSTSALHVGEHLGDEEDGLENTFEDDGAEV
jgi:hypothetical protein